MPINRAFRRVLSDGLLLMHKSGDIDVTELSQIAERVE